MGKVDLTKSDEDNKTTLASFTSCILQILDNFFNYYPGCDNDSYYPRPGLRESRNEYVLRINNLKRKKAKITNSLRQSLIHMYNINVEHQHAISLLEPKLKHKINEKAQNLKDQRCVYRVATTGENNPVKMNPDGSVDVGKIMHIAKGANVRIDGGVLKSPDQTVHVQNLWCYPINNGTIDFNGEKRNVTEWMNDCTVVSQKLIALIKQ